MQKTAKKVGAISPAVAHQAVAAGNATWLTPSSFDASYQQWGNIGQAYQPTITWQDTTSNATYSSASSVLNVT